MWDIADCIAPGLPAIATPGHLPAAQAAAIFDFNGTLVTGEVWQAIESWMGGRSAWKRRKSRMIARQLPVILASKVGLVSADFMVRRWMPAAWATVRGMDERELAALVQHAWETIFRPTMREPVAEMVRQRKAEGHCTVLLSATYEPFLEPVREALGFDVVIGTRVEVVAGQVTGRVIGDTVTGAEKVRRIMAMGQDADSPIDLERSLAYADTERDLDLLQLVGNPVAVWPNDRLHQIARRQKWPIMRDAG